MRMLKSYAYFTSKLLEKLQLWFFYSLSVTLTPTEYTNQT